MQDRSFTVEQRKRGPDVWCFRWREGGPDGRMVHRRIVLGTGDDLKNIASARSAVVGLRREINSNNVRIRRESIRLADLSRHFQQLELVRGNTRIAHSTRKALGGQVKTGQLGSLQKRPTDVAQDVVLLSCFLLIGQVHFCSPAPRTAF